MDRTHVHRHRRTDPGKKALNIYDVEEEKLNKRHTKIYVQSQQRAGKWKTVQTTTIVYSTVSPVTIPLSVFFLIFIQFPNRPFAEKFCGANK